MEQRHKKFLPHISAGLLAGAMAFTAPQEAPGGRPILTAYQDIVGVWTACLGHTNGVVPGKTYTKTECDVLDAQDSTYAISVFMDTVTYPADQSTTIAMQDFILNEGSGNWEKSSMLRDLNAGAHDAACQDLFKFECAGHWADGKDHGPPCHTRRYVQDLANRRQAEYAVCMKESP